MHVGPRRPESGTESLTVPTSDCLALRAVVWQECLSVPFQRLMLGLEFQLRLQLLGCDPGRLQIVDDAFLLLVVLLLRLHFLRATAYRYRSSC